MATITSYFLIASQGLSKEILDVKRVGNLKGIHISQSLLIAHLLCMDDILTFCDGSRRDLEVLIYILDLFSRAIGMIINNRKSTFMFKC